MTPRTKFALPLLLVGFAALRALSLATHEMWRDELQAWGVATQTQSLTEFATALRAEGHPPLWYSVLRAVSYGWPDPVAMQVLTWVIGVAVAALVLWRAPAPLWVRVAVLAGYYLGYEYAALSRSYNLGVLLLVGALAALTASRPRRGWATVLLVGLALTSAFGAALAVAVGAAMVLDARRTTSTWALVRGATVITGLVLVGALAVRGLFGGNPGLGQNSDLPGRVYSASRGLMALFPVPDLPRPRWGSTLLDPVPGRIALVVLAVVVAAFAWGLWPDRPAVALWLTAAVLVELITFATGVRDLRHLGHLTLAMLGALWFARRPGPVQRPRSSRSVAEGIGMVVIVVGLVAGPTAIVTDVRDRFSPTGAMADYLADALPADARVLADTDVGTSGEAITLNRPFSFPATDAQGTYARWNARTCRVLSNAGGCVPRAELLADAERLAGDGPVWLLLTYPVDDPRLEPMHSVVGGQVTGEDAYAYRLRETE